MMAEELADAIALMQDKRVRSLVVEPGEDGAYEHIPLINCYDFSVILERKYET